jgi:hypothetical protein
MKIFISFFLEMKTFTEKNFKYIIFNILFVKIIGPNPAWIIYWIRPVYLTATGLKTWLNAACEPD